MVYLKHNKQINYLIIIIDKIRNENKKVNNIQFEMCSRSIKYVNNR